VPSDTAVCLAGEVRALIFPVVQRRLRKTLLQPLGADTFGVLSRQWSQGWHITEQSNFTEWATVPTVTDADLSTVLQVLQPVAAIVTNASIDLYPSAASGTSWLAAVLAYLPGCDRAHPDMIECEARVAAALRMQGCLRLIEAEEARRSQAYRTVLYTRPDVWLPCALTAPLDWAAGDANISQWATYSYDMLTVMPRAVASPMLAQLTESQRVSPCRSPKVLKEVCSPCQLRGKGVWINTLESNETGHELADVARHCQLLSDERKHRHCSGLGGPPDPGVPVQPCRPRVRPWLKPVFGKPECLVVPQTPRFPPLPRAVADGLSLRSTDHLTIHRRPRGER
tara:strand:+ start:1436 stop:2455 length:1020 start_codon:yes stop_codon:yes gene_type:complete